MSQPPQPPPDPPIETTLSCLIVFFTIPFCTSNNPGRPTQKHLQQILQQRTRMLRHPFFDRTMQEGDGFQCRGMNPSHAKMVVLIASLRSTMMWVRFNGQEMPNAMKVKLRSDLLGYPFFDRRFMPGRVEKEDEGFCEQ